MIGQLFLRELKLLIRNRSSLLNPLAFMFLAVMLFAIAGPNNEAAKVNSAGALLWLIVLLTNVIALDGMFRRDYDNGVLEQIVLGQMPLFLVVLMRIFVQWLGTGFLMTLLSPILGSLLGLPEHVLWVTALGLLLGTPALSLLGGIGASLTVGFSRAGALLGLLVLPLCLPPLSVGASGVTDYVDGNGNSAQLYWLAFISMVALLIGPFATAAGLKISLQLQ